MLNISDIYKCAIIAHHCYCSVDVKYYYNRHMPYVTAQPKVREDILSSLLEKNASDFAAQQEWEAEWNQFGLASRLSEAVRLCSVYSVETIQCDMC